MSCLLFQSRFCHLKVRSKLRSLPAQSIHDFTVFPVHFLEDSDVRNSKAPSLEFWERNPNKCLCSWQAWPRCLSRWLVRIIFSLLKILYDSLNKWRNMDLRRVANIAPTKSRVDTLGERCWVVWKQALVEQTVQKDRVEKHAGCPWWFPIPALWAGG